MSEIGNGLKLTVVPGSQPMINKALSPSIFDKMTLSPVDNNKTSPNGTGNTSSTAALDVVAGGISPEGAMNIVNDIKAPVSDFSSELKVYIIPEDEPEGFLPDISLHSNNSRA